MTEQDVETIVQRAREKFPGATPRIISDNGPQFVAKDFKEFIRIGEGSLGWPEQAPYYAICVTATAASVPLPLQGQLTEGGRLVIPVGATYRGQQMMRYTLLGCEFLTENLGQFSFVPLIAEHPKEVGKGSRQGGGPLS